HRGIDDRRASADDANSDWPRHARGCREPGTCTSIRHRCRARDPGDVDHRRRACLRFRRGAWHHRADPAVHGIRSAAAAVCGSNPRRDRQRARRGGRRPHCRHLGIGFGAVHRRRVPGRRSVSHPDRRASRKTHGTLRTQRMILDLVSYAAFFLVTALSYGIMSLGLNVQWGQTGLFNVGVSGFVAIGAYGSALLTTPFAPDRVMGLGLPIWAGWIGAMLLSAAAAAVIGALTLRLRADYLAITTFGIAIVVQLLALNLEHVTGGPFGIGFIPRPFERLQETPLAFALA